MVNHGWLWSDALYICSAFNPDYEAIIKYVPLLLDVDFSDLLLPIYEYDDQLEIIKQSTWKMNAMAVHYDLNFGLCMHLILGEVISECVKKTRGLACLLAHFLTRGSDSNQTISHARLPGGIHVGRNIYQQTFIRWGNHPNVNVDCPITFKTLNKEERNSHAMCYLHWLCRA